MTPPTALFFYGTLRHRPLLDLVLGPPGAGRVRLRPATLQGHEALWVVGEDFPMIRRREGAVAEGLLAEGLLPDDAARLAFYEGAYRFSTRAVEVSSDGAPVRAATFFPDEEEAWQPGAPFELEDWVARWGGVTTGAAAEYMTGYGRWAGSAAARFWPRFRSRAWSRIIAAGEAAPAAAERGPGGDTVVEHRRIRRHGGFFALDEITLGHPAFSGGNVEVSREVFVGTDAALVLPYDPGTDRVALVEQFRIGPYVRGDARPWALEPVAGLVDPGEDPADCARREALEETGLELGRLVPVPGGYPSPGATTEFFHLYVGLCPLGPDDADRPHSGMADEGEDIRTHILTLDEAIGLTETGAAKVLPLAFLLFWTALNRERLAELA